VGVNACGWVGDCMCACEWQIVWHQQSVAGRVAERERGAAASFSPMMQVPVAAIAAITAHFEAVT